MILVVGLSPAWQQILVFDSILRGEVNRASEAHWCASGKVLNVGFACRALGADVKVLTLFGGATGDLAQQQCRKAGMDLEVIRTEAATRVCTTLLERDSGTVTELVENAPTVPSADAEAFAQRFFAIVGHADVVVFTGSLPQGIPSTYYRDLLRQTRVPAILDVRGKELESCLPLLPWLVKPNREELAKTLGRPLPDEHTLHAGMKDLLNQGAQRVLISQGSQSLCYRDPDNQRVFPTPSVTVMNPIGCGDSLAAGIAVGTQRGWSIEQSINLGIAAAAANATELLPARFSRSAVESQISGLETLPAE